MNQEETQLAKITQATQLLEKAKTLEEVLEVHDQASAVEAYARAKGADKAHSLALEVKLRAERKAGGFLLDMKAEGKLKPGNPRFSNGSMLEPLPTLSDLGIDKKESFRWQAIASIPGTKFEEYIATATRATQSKLLHMADLETVSGMRPSEPLPLPPGTFGVICADPPWDYELGSMRGGVDYHYPTMTLDELKALAPEVQKRAAEDCILFMWATMPQLREALSLIEAWGFNYRTGAVWVKDKFGTGYYFRGQHELLLLGTKGNPETPLESDRPSSVIQGIRNNHSQKPNSAYLTIERMYPNVKRLEMFATSPRENWETWGLAVSPAETQAINK